MDKNTKLVFQAGKLLGMGTLFAGRLGFALYQQHKIKKAAEEAARPPDPMEGLAGPDDLEKYRLTKESFYLGEIHSDHGRTFAAGTPPDDDRHIFIVAGSASGKGVTLGVQNVLRWPGPLLAIDPKGEMAEIAGMRRGTRDGALRSGTSVRDFIGQPVAILDPMGIVRGPAKKYRVKFDPVSDIEIRKRTAHRQIRKLAAGLIMPEQGENAHFSESAETILAGTIEAVKLTEHDSNHTLPFVRQVILGNVKPIGERVSKAREIAITGQGRTNEPVFDEEESRLGFEILLDYLKQSGVPKEGHAGEAVSVLREILGNNEAGSFRTTLSRNLKWLGDPDMRTHLRPSKFSLWNAVQKGWSIFVVLKPDDIVDFRHWLRMIVQTALSAKMALGTNQKGLQTLMVLDEFAALGRFKRAPRRSNTPAGRPGLQGSRVG